MKTHEFQQKLQAAEAANRIGWLDTDKMKKEGIVPSQYINKRLTGYQKPENPFKEGMTFNPKR